MGKCFCLRGGQEHRVLALSQLQRLESPDRYVYKEKSSKNRQGGIAQLKLEHKTVPIFSNSEAGVRCPVHLIDKYISKLPLDAVKKDIFYCRPLPNVPVDETKPWYVATPVGRNQLCQMVSKMCEMAKIKGVKTNHSLRVSGASALFDAGVPERIIQSRTGHRSLESLRVYEHVTDEQNVEVSKILSGSKKNFQKTSPASPNDTEEPKPIPEVKTEPEACSSLNDKSATAAPQYNNCTVNMYGMMPGDPCYPQYQPYGWPSYPPYYDLPPLYDRTNLN